MGRAQPPNMSVRGTANAPIVDPVALVTLLDNGDATYEACFTTRTPEGRPLYATWGGSWGHLVAAGRR